MGDTFKQVLIPLQQAIIVFHGYELVAVRLPDNRVAAVLNSLCVMLGIRTHGQVQRIRRSKDLAPHLLLALVDTPGGPQRMDVLVAEAIPFWVLGVQAEQLASEKRPLILALKEEAVEVLYWHFFHTDPEPQPEQPQALPRSPRELIQQGFEMIGEAFQMLEARQQTTDEQMTTLAAQQEVLQEAQQAMGDALVETKGRQNVAEEKLEAMGDYLVETRERVTALEQQRHAAPGDRAGDVPLSDGPILSPQHLAQMYVLAREARRQRGTPVSAQLAALAGAFGVPDVSDLPDAAWDEVLAWFWEGRQRG